MAHKKGQGSTRNGAFITSIYRGVQDKYGGEAVIPGNILIRQVALNGPRQKLGMGNRTIPLRLAKGTIY
ncbi:UNVERIFIED_CONTAM: hypothetical protein GTU68_001110 [Idotea baltica]|nr:hypothetical protein [Idotea baltica]